jgi:hypothetical protein
LKRRLLSGLELHEEFLAEYLLLDSTEPGAGVLRVSLKRDGVRLLMLGA